MKFVVYVLAFLSFAVSANTADEIDYLVAFVENTQCTYERNGKFHSGAEAAEHILKKYNHFKSDIVTTEDFIEYSATKSKMSGKYYLVHCDSQPVVKSKDWLLTELNNYRNQQQQ